MFERILVPLDGSETAEAALAYAALLPSRGVRLLHVQPKIVGPIRADPDLWDAWQHARAEETAAYLGQVGQSLQRQGRMVETAFQVGDPTQKIIEAAADADLTVMTTQGRGTAGRALFGSVADGVARQASTPTLLVRIGEGPATGPQVARVVVPLDGSALAEQSLPIAAALAGDLGVPLRLVHVLDHDTVRAAVQAGIAAASAYDRSQAAVQQHAEAYLSEQAHELRQQNLTVTADVLTGRAAVTLLDAIQRDDLVVMTTHGRGGVHRWLLGSIADKLVRAAVAPVLLVRARSQDARSPGDEHGGDAR